MDSPSEYQQGRVTPSTHYKPNLPYSIETFEAINDWLKTKSTAVTSSQRFRTRFKRTTHHHPTSTPLERVAVAEIIKQLSNWNSFSAQPGAVSSSQGGFLIGPGIIKSRPGTGSILTHDQQFSFQVCNSREEHMQGAPLCLILLLRQKIPQVDSQNVCPNLERKISFPLASPIMFPRLAKLCF